MAVVATTTMMIESWPSGSRLPRARRRPQTCSFAQLAPPPPPVSALYVFTLLSFVFCVVVAAAVAADDDHNEHSFAKMRAHIRAFGMQRLDTRQRRRVYFCFFFARHATRAQKLAALGGVSIASVG